MFLVNESMDRHELDRGDAEGLKVLDDGAVRHAGERAPLRIVEGRVAHRVAANVCLVEHGFAPRQARAFFRGRLALRGDDTAWYESGAVEIVVVKNCVVPSELTGEPPAVRVNQQLFRIAAQAPVPIIGPVHAIPVQLPRLAARQIAEPYAVIIANEVEAAGRRAAGIEQAQLDAFGGR